MRYALFILLLVLLPACGGASENGLAETSWLLESMPGYADLGPVQVSLQFDSEGAVGGVGGCNSYGGSYALSGANGIRFSEIFSTEMYCLDNNASEIEAAYFQALSQAQTYSRAAQSLRVQTALGELIFAVAP